VRIRTLILFGVFAGWAFGQQPTATPPSPDVGPGPNPLLTLASEFFEHDYVNVYAYGDGVLDTNNPVLTNTGQVRNSVGTGFDVGGGVSLAHAFKDGQVGLSYQGGYRDYQSTFYSSGTTQSLTFGLSKRLTRHLTMSISAAGGIFLYGGSSFIGATTPEVITPVATNPFSPETKFVSGGIGLNYQQTRRLSYSLFGNYFLARYNYAGAIGTTGLSGGAAVNYRLTVRNTLSGSYSHSYFTYQHNVGNASVDQVGLSLAHAFNNHWTLSIYGGVARSNASGFVVVPVTFVSGNQAIGGYVLGKYNQTSYIPAYSATITHWYRRTALTLTGGEGIAPSGNGYFLASRNVYFSGVYSYSLHKQNISLGGSVYRLTSVANAVSNSYSSAGFSASYGRSLFRYLGMFLRYDYTHYGALQPYTGISDNRIAFGFSFSSQSVPLTLF
jgi:hypothetical protein